MAFTPITVTGKYLGPDDQPCTGQVRFQLSAPMQDAADLEFRQPVLHICILDGGAMVERSTGLPPVLAATDDPTTQPVGVTYTVTEEIDQAPGPPRVYSIPLSHLSPGGTVDLASIAPIIPGTLTYTYTLVLASIDGGSASATGAGVLVLDGGGA